MLNLNSTYQAYNQMILQTTKAFPAYQSSTNRLYTNALVTHFAPSLLTQSIKSFTDSLAGLTENLKSINTPFETSGSLYEAKALADDEVTTMPTLSVSVQEENGIFEVTYLDETYLSDNPQVTIPYEENDLTLTIDDPGQEEVTYAVSLNEAVKEHFIQQIKEVAQLAKAFENSPIKEVRLASDQLKKVKALFTPSGSQGQEDTLQLEEHVGGVLDRKDPKEAVRLIKEAKVSLSRISENLAKDAAKIAYQSVTKNALATAYTAKSEPYKPATSGFLLDWTF